MLITFLWNRVGGTFFCVATKSIGGVWREKWFTREEFPLVESYVRDNIDKNVYFCPHGFTAKKRQKEYAVLPTLCYADLDAADPRKMVEWKPTIAIESSPDRWVGFWLFDKPIENELNKKLTHLVGADPSGFDLTQVLRVPGTINYKYVGKPKVETRWTEGRHFRKDQLVKAKAANGHAKEDDHDGGGEKDLSGSGRFYAKVCGLIERGWSAGRIEGDIKRRPGGWAETSAARYEDRGRLRQEIERCFDKLGKTPYKGALVMSSEEFIAGFSPPDYLIRGVLQRRFVYSFTGRTGSGKTAIALLIAQKVVEGSMLGDRRAEKGQVLYFAGENPDDVRMRWIGMKGKGVHFIAGTGVSLTGDLEKVGEEVKAIGGVSLIIIDTGPAYFEGDDENDNVQAGSHARALRALCGLPGGPTVIVCCHPAKHATEDNLTPRGGSAFLNEVDGNLTCRQVGEGILQVHWSWKFRGADWTPLTFETVTYTTKRVCDSDGEMIPLIRARSLTEEEGARREDAEGGRDEACLKYMAGHERSSISDIARGMWWMDRQGNPAKMGVWRLLGKLEKQGMVVKDGSRYKLTRKGIDHVNARSAEKKKDKSAKTVEK